MMMARSEYAVAAQALDAESAAAVVLCVSMLLRLDLCWLYLSLNRHSYCFMFGRCFILAMLLSCHGGGLNA
jgi:hypothetical protein